jgi:L-alanine-DL-glutamate epimerase-like enolase superfamily enzyme
MPNSIRLHELIFKQPAGTSRGVLHSKPSWLLTYRLPNGELICTEFPVIPGLSPEYNNHEQYEQDLNDFLSEALPFFELRSHLAIEQDPTWLNLLQKWQNYPSFIFGIELLIFAFRAQGSPVLFDSPFTRGQTTIPINGLVWMDTKLNMRAQIQDKIAQGFKVVKLKIGAIQWSEELALIEEIRAHFSEEQITIRVDANGAFTAARALDILDQLKQLQVHSIEQPIEAGNLEQMADLCAKQLIPIALDEELIGVSAYNEKVTLLKKIRPQYIILKPSLHGGFSGTKEWISIAESLGIGWWLTSALESAIGLNAIVQFGATYSLNLAQGFGTGGLYTNNLESNLAIHNGQMHWINDLSKG